MERRTRFPATVPVMEATKSLQKPSSKALHCVCAGKFD
jgi:hypothetical protein